MTPLQTVQHIYAAFQAGDVPAILAHLADDVEWEYGLSSTDVPWLRPRRGRGEVAGFFEALGGLDFTAFRPTAFFESGDTVLVLIDLEARVKQTGRAISEIDEVHIWHFDATGHVSRFRHRSDTHQHWLAYATMADGVGR